MRLWLLESLSDVTNEGNEVQIVEWPSWGQWQSQHVKLVWVLESYVMLPSWQPGHSLPSMCPCSVTYPPTAQCKGKLIYEQLFLNQTVMDNWPCKVNRMLFPGILNCFMEWANKGGVWCRVRVKVDNQVIHSHVRLTFLEKTEWGNFPQKQKNGHTPRAEARGIAQHHRNKRNSFIPWFPIWVPCGLA